MAVPDYQSLMLPLLKIASDGKEHGFSEVLGALAVQFKMTDEERKEQLPSGTQARFENRVRWAQIYLKKAGLLENPRRGRFRVTERGMRVLKEDPPHINVKFLRQYPEFLEFQRASKQDDGQDEQDQKDEIAEQTPEESLESSYQSLRRDLGQELLSRVKGCSPGFFEKLVVDLLVAMGYGGSRIDAGQAVGRSGDGGVDGIIKEDKLGLDAVYLQAKRWEGTVGRPTVQEFAGSLDGYRARKGVLITTSGFSKEARDYADKIEKKIVLIDGEQLVQLMIDHGVGVGEAATYTVKKVDLDYFGDEE